MLFPSKKKWAAVAPHIVVQAASKEQGAECLVSIDGSITVDSAADVRTQLLQCVGEPDCAGVIVDFSNVTYVDTSALAILLEILRVARTLNKSFELHGLRDRPRYLFETTRLLRLFEKQDRDAPASETSGSFL